MVDLLKLIRNVPDFPKKGIQFKDVTTLVADHEGLRQACDELAAKYKDRDISKVVGVESRGYIFGSVVAYLLDVGFILARKPGKLPADVYSAEYDLEYGENRLEMHKDAISEGERVLIVDDLLATGGSSIAAAKLVEMCGGVVEDIAFIVTLTGSLKGREALEKAGYSMSTLLEIGVDE